MILLWDDNQDPPCQSVVHIIFRYHQSKLPFVSAFVFCDPTPDCIVMKKQWELLFWKHESWNQVSVSREASSLFPSWGRASCVAQRWPLSSQRESAYWRSPGQVSLWFWLNAESQLQRTSPLSYLCVFIVWKNRPVNTTPWSYQQGMKEADVCTTRPLSVLCGLDHKYPSSSLCSLPLCGCSATWPERQWTHRDFCRRRAPSSLLHRVVADVGLHPHVCGGPAWRLPEQSWYVWENHPIALMLTVTATFMFIIEVSLQTVWAASA